MYDSMRSSLFITEFCKRNFHIALRIVINLREIDIYLFCFVLISLAGVSESRTYDWSLIPSSIKLLPVFTIFVKRQKCRRVFVHVRARILIETWEDARTRRMSNNEWFATSLSSDNAHECISNYDTSRNILSIKRFFTSTFCALASFSGVCQNIRDLETSQGSNYRIGIN